MKRLCSIILALIMLVLTSSVSMAAITEDENFTNYNETKTLSPSYTSATVNRYEEDENGELVTGEDGEPSYAMTSETTTKLFDNHYCAPRQINQLANAAFRDENKNILTEKVDDAFYVTLDRVGEYVGFKPFGTGAKYLRRIDLFLKSEYEVDFEVLVAVKDNTMVSVYEGKTYATGDKNIACYYPIVLDEGSNVHLANVPTSIMIKVKGYDENGAALSDGTLLPGGKSLQIAEMRINCNNAKDILAHDVDFSETFREDAYYKLVNSSKPKVNYPYEYGASQYFVGYSVSGVSVTNNDTKKYGSVNSNLYMYVSSGDTAKGSTYSYYSYMFPSSGWPVNHLNNGCGSLSEVTLLKVVPDANRGDCWWMGDMGKKPQAINHIAINEAQGTATKVEVYSSNDMSGSYNENGIGDKAFANPDVTKNGWVLRGSAEDANGVEEVFIYDSEPARLWMVKIVDYSVEEGQEFQLNPFNIYLRREADMPELIGEGAFSGEVKAGETLTYTLTSENLRDSAAVYFAIYKDGALEKVMVKNIAAGADVAATLDTATVSCTVPAELTTGNLTARAFLWDKGTLVPLVPDEPLPAN